MTNPNSMTHAHDKFVRTAMADLRVARDFFKAHLPKEILNSIDLNQLVLQPRSHINDIRKESTVDLLYKTRMNEQEAYFYILLEHQSKPDKLMPFRMLKYTCNVIDSFLKDNQSKDLPLVYPMVIYHGESAYPYSTNINDLIAAPKELVERYFLKPFQLIDLGKIEDEELKKHAWSGVMEFTLKHIFARDILPYLQDITEIMRRIDQSGGRDYIAIVLEYMFERGELSDRQNFFQLIQHEISPDVGEKVMTLSEQFRAEGRTQGRAEGVAKGIAKGKIERELEIVKNLRATGAELTFIAKVTALPLIKVQEYCNEPAE